MIPYNPKCDELDLKLKEQRAKNISTDINSLRTTLSVLKEEIDTIKKKINSPGIYLVIHMGYRLLLVTNHSNVDSIGLDGGCLRYGWVGDVEEFIKIHNITILGKLENKDLVNLDPGKSIFSEHHYPIEEQ